MSEEPKAIPIIASLADLKSWDIGPATDGTAGLKLQLYIKNFEDVATIKALASGQVVLRLLPIQIGLPLSSDCSHPIGQRFPWDNNNQVCLECGQMVPREQDDQPAPEPGPESPPQ